VRRQELAARLMARDVGVRRQFSIERESFVASAETKDFREGVAAFVERRRPVPRPLDLGGR
jgi:hypothetical protein